MRRSALLLFLPITLLLIAQDNVYHVSSESDFDQGQLAIDLGHTSGKPNCPAKCQLNLLSGPTRVEVYEGQPFNINFRIDGNGGLGGGNEMTHSGGGVSWGDGTFTDFKTGPIPGKKADYRYTGLVSFNQTLRHTYTTAATTYKIRAYMQGDFKISDTTGSCSYRCRSVVTVPVLVKVASH